MEGTGVSRLMRRVTDRTRNLEIFDLWPAYGSLEKDSHLCVCAVTVLATFPGSP